MFSRPPASVRTTLRAPQVLPLPGLGGLCDRRQGPQSCLPGRQTGRGGTSRPRLRQYQATSGSVPDQGSIPEGSRRAADGGLE